MLRWWILANEEEIFLTSAKEGCRSPPFFVCSQIKTNIHYTVILSIPNKPFFDEL